MNARIDAVTALFAGPFVAGCALLIVFAVAYVLRAERRPGRLPLACRLRGHHWRARVHGGYVRDTCPRCAPLDVPSPDLRIHPPRTFASRTAEEIRRNLPR